MIQLKISQRFLHVLVVGILQVTISAYYNPNIILEVTLLLVRRYTFQTGKSINKIKQIVLFKNN